MADRNFIVNMVIGARDQATRIVRGISAAFGKLNNRVTQVGTALATYFGASALANFFGGAIGSARDFEAQLARVEAATGATADEMAKLEAAASEAGRTTQFTETQAAQGLEILGRAGVSATDSIKLLPVVLNTAVAAGTDLATAAGLVTDSLGAFNKRADEAGRFADVLAQGARLANTSIEDLGGALSYAGVQASQMDLSVEETVGLLDALANAGIRGERAGTALRNILSQLQNPASTARAALRKLGIDTDNLTTVLDGLSEAGPDAQQAILAFGAEAGPALRILLQTGTKGLAEYLAKLKEASGTSKEMADTISDKLDGAVKGLGSSWDALRRKLVDPLLEPITEQVEKLTATFDRLTTGEQIKQFQAQLVASFGSGVKAIKDFVRESGGVPGIFKTVVTGTQRATQALAALAAQTRKIAGGVKLAYNLISITAKGAVAFFAGLAASTMQFITLIGKGLNKLGIVTDKELAGMENATRAFNAAWDHAAAMVNEDVSDIGDAFSMMTGAAEDSAEAQEAAAKRTEEAAERQRLAIEGVTTAAEDGSDAYKFLAADIAAAASAQELAAAKVRAADLFAEGQLSAQEYSQALDGARARLDELAKAADPAASGVKKIGDAATEAGAQAGAAAKGVDALSDSIQRAGSTDDLDKAQGKLRAMFNAGTISADEMVKGLGQVADRTTVLADEADKAGQNLSDTGDEGEAAGKQIATAMDDAQRAVKGNATAAQYVSNYLKKVRAEMEGLSQEALELFNTNFANSALVQTFSRTQSVTDKTREAVANLAHELTQLQLERIATLPDGVARIINDINIAAAQAKLEFTKVKGAADSLADSIETGALHGTQLLALNAEQLRARFELLGDERLSGLIGSLQQAQRETQQLRDSAESTLESLQGQLLELQGSFVEIEKQRAAQQRGDIRDQLKQAQAGGDATAVADLQKALQVLDQLEKKRIEQAKQREQEDRAQARQARQAPGPTTAPQTRNVIELKAPDGGSVELQAASDDDARRVIETLKQAGMRTR